MPDTKITSAAMTKPADSGQIAKARERAEKRMRELLFHAQSSNGTVPRVFSESHLTEVLYEFAASERQAVIEECCRAVCSLCSGLPHFGTKMSQAKYCESSKNWKHYSESEGEDFYVRCAATAIRSME